MSEFYNNSIFWVEVDRISPNPYQPRKDFNDDKIEELADSIKQYGVLQPLVVTRKETEKPDGGIAVEYELIAGERRLRASKLAGLSQVPVIIRAQEETNKMKLELAIIENLQREDLNPLDRAKAFKQLVDEFNLKHTEIAKKVGKSREYVSNTIRLLGLPEHIQNALAAGEISEGHARPLLMLGERPAERDTLFNEIKMNKLTVRESERIARRIATDKARKQDLPPELITIEKELTESLGTRVQIEKRTKNGGKVHIDYFSKEDLERLLTLLAQDTNANKQHADTSMATATIASEQVNTNVQKVKDEPDHQDVQLHNELHESIMPIASQQPNQNQLNPEQTHQSPAQEDQKSVEDILKEFNENFATANAGDKQNTQLQQFEQTQQAEQFQPSQNTVEQESGDEYMNQPMHSEDLLTPEQRAKLNKLEQDLKDIYNRQDANKLTMPNINNNEPEQPTKMSSQNDTWNQNTDEPFNPFLVPNAESDGSTQDGSDPDPYDIKNFTL